MRSNESQPNYPNYPELGAAFLGGLIGLSFICGGMGTVSEFIQLGSKDLLLATTAVPELIFGVGIFALSANLGANALGLKD